MRILEVATNFRPGGIQRHVLDLSAFLAAQGHEVLLAGDGGEWAEDARRIGFAHVSLDSVSEEGGSTVNRLRATLRAAIALRRLLRRHRIEVAHAHETAPLFALRLAAVGLGIPVIFTFHGATPEREAAVAGLARRAATLTVSPSQASLDALIAKGLPRNRTRRLGLGVGPLAETVPAEVAALRDRLLGSEGRFLVLSLSRLSAQKGIDVMIDVAARVAAKRRDVVFAVAGGGASPTEAEAWARAAGVSDMMRFLGPVRNVADYLRAADLFLLTSRWENLPISIVEAFRAGLPVIATDCGGVRELVDSTVGALLPVGDAAGIADAVLGLVENADLRRRKGAAAHERSTEPRFDPDTVHAGFEALYRDILR